MSGLRQRPSAKSYSNRKAAQSAEDRFQLAARPEKTYGVLYFVFVALELFVLWYLVHMADEFLPEPKSVNASDGSFSALRARRHLEALTGIGDRPVGSFANDVQAMNYIMDQLKEISSNANDDLNIEYHIQHPSGSFAYVRDIFELGMTGAYDNVTNIVIKISKKFVQSPGCLLVNAHFDTAPKTEGASDDTVSCAVVLETLRALSKDSSSLKAAVVFLLNGAEEAVLHAAHGFVTQHPWVKDIKTVINLEAAGSGGREFVFQTGPENPWILEAYASSAPYPFASVLAQEIFQSDIIPSDTDFRVFVKYGNLTGIDLAFIKNGYVYHTKHDNAASIPSGSIQRAGDNVLELVKALSHSPYIREPGEYRHGDVVFFDVLGLFMIHYPKRLHLFLNKITCAIVIAYVLLISKFKKTPQYVGHLQHAPHILNVFFCVAVILASWFFGAVVSASLSWVVLRLGFPMSWYTHPVYGLMLYGLPTLWGMLVPHYVGGIMLEKTLFDPLRYYAYAHILIFAILLLIADLAALSATFMMWFWVAFPFLFTSLPLDMLRISPEKWNVAEFVSYLLGYAFPGLMTMYMLQQLFSFFIPLLGRTGTEIPGDYVVAVASSAAVVLVFTFLVPLVHRHRNIKGVIVSMLLISCIPFTVLLTGHMAPYSAQNPVTPKRLVLKHILRTFYDVDGTIRKQDSGIWVQPLDYLKTKYIEDLPFYRNMVELQCEGAYCGMPHFFPERQLAPRIWFLRGEAPPHLKPLTPSVYKRETMPGRAVRFSFEVRGNGLMHLYIQPSAHATLSDWSLSKGDDGNIPKTPDMAGSYTHFVMYSHGYYSGNWKFWLEFTMLSDSEHTGQRLAEVAIARHYLTGNMSRTSFLTQAVNALPNFVCDQSYVSCYDSFSLS